MFWEDGFRWFSSPSGLSPVDSRSLEGGGGKCSEVAEMELERVRGEPSLTSKSSEPTKGDPGTVTAAVRVRAFSPSVNRYSPPLPRFSSTPPPKRAETSFLLCSILSQSSSSAGDAEVKSRLLLQI